VKSVRSLVQLEVAPESMIHCESPGTPSMPKISLWNIGNNPLVVVVIEGVGIQYCQQETIDQMALSAGHDSFSCNQSESCLALHRGHGRCCLQRSTWLDGLATLCSLVFDNSVNGLDATFDPLSTLSHQEPCNGMYLELLREEVPTISCFQV